MLARHGYHWRAVPKIHNITPEQLQKRKTFIHGHADYNSEWWVKNMNLVLDGVTLSMAPRPFSGRQRHAAQSIRHMWVKDGEKPSEKMLTYNRYGLQLGVKVPLWGRFTGGGSFVLRQYATRAKMTKEE